MGMITYDGLNCASESCKTDRLTVWKVPCLSKQSTAGQIVAGTCIYIMRSSSGLFHVHINAKSVNQFPAGKRKFTPPSFRKECKRQCYEDAAVKF